MKQARIEWQGQVRDVLVDERDQVRLPDGTVLKEGEFRWLPPADGTLFALGLNYADHASELEFKPPTEPLVFIKAPNTFTGHQQQSVRPDNVEYMHYEAELVVVIGKTARRVSEAEAMDYVAGYTVCNDYAIRDYLENYYRPNLRVKSRDTLTPIGPWIVAKEAIPDPHNLALRTWVNGELRQEGGRGRGHRGGLGGRLCMGGRRQHQHDGQQHQGVQDAGDRGAPAGADVGGGAGDGTGGREAWQ